MPTVTLPLFIALIKKELLLLSRDLQGLLLLFVMPAVFILIMTFALQNQYDINARTQLDFYLINHDNSATSQQLVERLQAIDAFHSVDSSGDETQLRNATAADAVKFMIVIAPDFEQHLIDQEPALTIEFAPATSPVIMQMVNARVDVILNRLFVDYNYADLMQEGGFEFDLDKSMSHSLSLYQGDDEYPTSVQQNVPAWLLFAMFFIAIPLSTTLISERQQGTLLRLQSMGVSSSLLLAGKLVPFLAINLLQAGLMFLIGIYLVPLLGGDRLHLGAHPTALLVMTLAASLAAVSYSLLIATLSRTIEQATIFAAVCNIIMAAVGGVMVPRFIMPASMQELSVLSPMAWDWMAFSIFCYARVHCAILSRKLPRCVDFRWPH